MKYKFLSKNEVDRSSFSLIKFKFLLKVLFFGRTKGYDFYLDKFLDIDIKEIENKTGKSFKYILLDVDACIAPEYDDILVENLDKIQDLLNSGVKIAIYSNCKAMKRLNPIKKMNIPIYDGEYEKPRKEGFLDVCLKFGFPPKETWMVGDNPITDGGAIGVLGGMIFVKAIPPNLKKLTIFTRMKLSLQKIVLYLSIRSTLH